MAVYNYKITKSFDSKSLQEYLSYYHLGKEKIKQLKIYINGELVSLNYILNDGDDLKIESKEHLDIKSFDYDFEIVYEDEYLLIINKPPGFIIHSDGNDTNTVSNMVANYYQKKGLDIPVRYIHRLDKETSGILIFAKDILSMSRLSFELESHEFKRDYLALVKGLYSKRDKIDLKIAKDRHVNGKFRVSSTGKDAITYVKVISKFKDYTLVRLSLKTGRTHQIRVHMSYLGHPLLGDTLYGGDLKLIERCALHSYYVSFKHPIYERMVNLTLGLPHDMENLKNNRA